MNLIILVIKLLTYMDRAYQKQSDEKRVAQIFRDIETGGFRRRRGGNDDFDLDDSDDEYQARKREKQRENAKMRKALLADEKVGELAENPKKVAFFRAIEDRDDDDDVDLDFLQDEETHDSGNGASQEDPSSQDVSQKPSNQDPAQEGSNDNDNNDSNTNTNKRKMPSDSTSADDHSFRPPPHLRRTPANSMSKKPKSLAEIRETLSFITERPEYDSFNEVVSMDIDEPTTVDQNAENADIHSDDDQPERRISKDGFAIPAHPRRTRGPVVDRLAIQRKASLDAASSGTGSINTRKAFYSGADVDFAGNIAFRRPALLRKPTNGSSTSSSSSSTSSTTSSSSTGFKGPTASSGPTVAKKGAVNYYTAVREREREKEIRLKQRPGSAKITAFLSKHSDGLGALGRKGQWD